MYSWSLEAELNQLLHVSCFWLTATWIPLLTLGNMRTNTLQAALTPHAHPLSATTLNKAEDTTCLKFKLVHHVLGYTTEYSNLWYPGRGHMSGS